VHPFLRTILAVSAIGCSIGCGTTSEEGAVDAQTSGTTQELVETLSLLAGDALSANAVADWVAKIEGGETTTDALVASLIDSSRIGERVAPNLLFTTFLNAKNYYAVPAMYTLKRTPGSGASPILYLREPCTASEAVEVKPWWDLGSTVRICPDSYRPERWILNVDEHSYRSRMVLGCDGQVGSPEKEDKSLCGCGPNLIRCLQDGEQYLDMHASMAKEVRDTTAYIVNNDMKLSRLFTGNQTVRDRNSEYLYQRGTLGALEGEGANERIRTLRSWPEEGLWAKREQLFPGQHAGVLTSHQLLNWAPDRRQRQRLFFEVMWCEGRDSFGATTEKIFEVSENPNLAFTHDSWERLAHTDVCTKCHARLDYGFQFFMGYPDGRATTHIMPSLVREGEGALYGKDINDSRGTARLTPAGFARHAVAQPEYASCMASQISNYVLGPEAPLEEHQEVLASFEKTGEFRETLGTALRLYAKRYATKAEKRVEPVVATEKPATEKPAAAKAQAAAFAPNPKLREMLEEHCVACHDDAAIPFESVAKSYGLAVYLGGETLTRPLAVRMLDQVAYENMPRGKTLPHGVRKTLVTAIIEELWPAGDGRENAMDYYLGQMRALPGHQLDVALQATRDASGLAENVEDSLDWGTIERSVYSDQNILAPGYLAILALESAQDCRASAGEDDEAFATCLQHVFRLARLSR